MGIEEEEEEKEDEEALLPRKRVMEFNDLRSSPSHGSQYSAFSSD
jgi:hypothetical protein